MYLTSKQHDRLQVIVTSFEIPYRTYIATEIIKHCPNEASFKSVVNTKTLSLPSNTNAYKMINSELGKVKTNPSHCYEQLKNAKKAKEDRIVVDEIDVPNVGTIISLSIIFLKNSFHLLSLISLMKIHI